MESKWYFRIESWMTTELHLTGADLIIYALLYAHRISNGISGVKYITEHSGYTTPAVIRSLKRLTELGLVYSTKNKTDARRKKYTAVEPQKNKDII